MNKLEIKAIFIRVLLISLIIGLVLFFTKAKQSTLDSTPSLSAKSLSENRQILRINADSLISFLNKIQQEQPNVFEVENDGNSLNINSLDIKPFNAIFFDGEYISRFNDIRNAGVKKRNTEGSFSLPIEKNAGIRYVRIPAEIMQSIQLQK